VVSEVPVERTD